MPNQPWTKKYAPKNSKEIYGQNKAVEQLLTFLKNYMSQKHKAAIIYGEPGCGKTSSVHAIADELDLELHEINASDVRNSDAINQLLGAIMGQQSLFFKEKLILVDEIDGVSSREDRGGVTALSRIITNSKYPVVMTANNPYHKKFSDLRKKSLMIEFHSLAYPTILSVLQKISKGEDVKFDDTALTALSRRAGGDLRGAITDLQTLSQSTKKLEIDDLDDISDRRQTESIIQAMMKVFKTVKPEVALQAYENIDENIDEIFLWVEENLPKEYKKPQDLARGFENLALADVFRRRIRRWQHWRFIVYIKDLLSAGIALSKDERYKEFTPYQPTKRILKLWQAKMKYEKRKAIAQKVAKHTHTSSKTAIQTTIPYMKKIFEKNDAVSKKIAEELGLTSDEATWLKK